MSNVNSLDDMLDDQTARVGEDWNESDERQKVNLINKVYSDSERRLKKARENMEKLDDMTVPDSAVIGRLYFMAYKDMRQVLHQARMRDRDTESFERRLEMFRQLVSPGLMSELSQKAVELRRTPAKLRTILDERRENIEFLIDSTYAGTEVVKEGSSNENREDLAEV